VLGGQAARSLSRQPDPGPRTRSPPATNAPRRGRRRLAAAHPERLVPPGHRANQLRVAPPGCAGPPFRSALELGPPTTSTIRRAGPRDPVGAASSPSCFEADDIPGCPPVGRRGAAGAATGSPTMPASPASWTRLVRGGAVRAATAIRNGGQGLLNEAQRGLVRPAPRSSTSSPRPRRRSGRRLGRDGRRGPAGASRCPTSSCPQGRSASRPTCSPPRWRPSGRDPRRVLVGHGLATGRRGVCCARRRRWSEAHPGARGGAFSMCLARARWSARRGCSKRWAAERLGDTACAARGDQPPPWRDARRRVCAHAPFRRAVAPMVGLLPGGRATTTDPGIRQRPDGSTRLCGRAPPGPPQPDPPRKTVLIGSVDPRASTRSPAGGRRPSPNARDRPARLFVRTEHGQDTPRARLTQTRTSAAVRRPTRQGPRSAPRPPPPRLAVPHRRFHPSGLTSLHPGAPLTLCT
jgi:hypothetical protein